MSAPYDACRPNEAQIIAQIEAMEFQVRHRLIIQRTPGPPIADKAPDAELVVYLVGGLASGGRLSLVGLQEQLPRLAGVLKLMGASKRWIAQAIAAGVQRRTPDGRLERVRPCPGHVIAGWLALGVPDPSYLPPPAYTGPPRKL